ncbi:MAG: FKBP-type peptidyl-prolyl cis-trans isomerase [Thermonemataceae bacterium]|nr:FKBP-type peptidyl-prolyl cis-trans isomerase [Thermonemataceae bacterium]
MKKVFWQFLAIILLAATACEKPRQESGETRLPSGVSFKVIKRNEKGAKLKENEFVVLRFLGKVGDTVIQNTFKDPKPVTLQIQSVPGSPAEVFPFLQIGDSVHIKVPLDTLIKRNPYFEMLRPKGKTVEYFVKIESIKSAEERKKEIMALEKEAMKKQEELAKQNEGKENKTIEEYLAKNPMTLEVTPSGLKYSITQKNPAGAKPQSGDSVKVHYTGKLLNGKVFDSSIQRKIPFGFVLGQGQVIKGWDEGIALLRKGEKATLLIPSKLGYGAQGAGKAIPPFAPLVFEVELVDIIPSKK